ncbi:TM2 domain-containing protein [Silvanigrella aquatica]|uniref:TM2 domain-containing protein n=1 Tax=Silvanigrella aquatica TaxID=1915309 RepID=A0A1L4D359_9BACT|nr:TM2 domain-containing protein [Silvanigrella aquatica]APJ04633.1 hypothetical protein AXG55_12255 [Silvanigrella aquatica]
MNRIHTDDNTKHCKDCGNIINMKAEICPQCGCRQIEAPYNTGRNRLAAALFAFFLGGFGVHKFYLGSVMLGVLYLLFCWTFIPTVIAFIEGILYLIMSDSEFNNKYNK